MKYIFFIIQQIKSNQIKLELLLGNIIFSKEKVQTNQFSILFNVQPIQQLQCYSICR